MLPPRCNDVTTADAANSILNDVDTYSASAAARQLGTSVPRVLRVAAQLGIRRPGQGRKLQLSQADLDRVVASLGQEPRIPGLSRGQAKVLAALARAPRGLVSIRAVARRADVSPTTAGRSLAALVCRELVTAARETLAAGQAREATVYRANVASPLWPSLAPHLAELPLPESRMKSAERARVVPYYLRHLFWNTAPSQLDVATSAAYIARRLVSTGDPNGLAWGVLNLPPQAWEHAARSRGLAPQDRALARNIARYRNATA